MLPEFLISWRYLSTKRKEKFISLISVISILGIAIGVMALIVVLAVMSGFDNDLRDKIVGNYSHITISGYAPFAESEYEAILKKVSSNSHVRGVSPFIQGQILIKEENRYFAANVRGVAPSTEGKVSKLNHYIVKGSLKSLGPNNAILGKELAAYLGLDVGSKTMIYSPNGKKYALNVVGLFSSGMYDYDMHLAFMHIKTAEEIFGLKDQVSAISVKLDDMYLADKVKKELSAALGHNYYLKTWAEANQNFFAALQLEKLTMFVILTLIVLVASFNIISTLIVMVVEKTKDIGVLKALGMSRHGIRRIFIYEGLIIGILGTVLGATGGIGLCGLLKKYQFIKLPQDIYYIDRLPVAVNMPDVAVVVVAAIAITLISTVYPASKAAGLKPVEALRYE